ncbi:DUF3072 domain-containing protein [Streptomyces sp. SID10815]|uniref:DUF3072 domain-containing protein n=1 Tax=Streptomyces sp. SID10815 TaxID=2706027 RepID=UPI0031BB3D11
MRNGPRDPSSAICTRWPCEAGEDIPEGLTKAQASQMIDRLQQESPRTAGQDRRPPATDGDDPTR